ncbi:hypothetical protein T484DRAFT_1743391 [Baffinella frigidus]|nr:hypothetical protein T484DRAFT_1743391 [Cryptophyta sp. CCMP2293]
MGTFKRKRSFAKKFTKRSSYKKKRTGVKAVVTRMLKTHDKKMIETKHSMETFTDNQQINHNNFITLTSTPFATQSGTTDPTGRGRRIGDEITPTGYSYKMMVELNERISDCTYRLLVVKAAKGDIPTRGTLFVGQSGNKMLDNIDYERYSVIHQKFFKMKAPNHGTNSGNFVQFAGGTYMENAADADFTMTTFATRIIRGLHNGLQAVR